MARRAPLSLTVTTLARQPHEVGDGDHCEVEGHGRMLTIRGSVPPRQYCPHQGHDGQPKTHPDGVTPQTRAIFPLYQEGE